MFKPLVLALVPLLPACAQKNLDIADQSVSSKEMATLVTVRQDAMDLSRAYSVAARKTGRINDAGSYFTIAAAGATVAGAVASAPSTVVANWALVGVGGSTFTRREASKTTVLSIYAGAKVLNCIASVAGMGIALEMTDSDAKAASYATQGAIEFAKLSVRSGTIQDVADFSTVFAEFKKVVTESDFSLKTSAVKAAVGNTAGPLLPLKDYLAMLGVCTDPNKTPLATVPPATQG